jgi:hypothetical protein
MIANKLGEEAHLFFQILLGLSVQHSYLKDVEQDPCGVRRVCDLLSNKLVQRYEPGIVNKTIYIYSTAVFMIQFLFPSLSH